MIKFTKYFNLVVEGGNVFKANPTQRIDLANIKPTVDFLSNIVGINLMGNLLGSTGKRPSSGDLDIAILDSKISKIKLYDILAQWCQERNLNPKDYIAKSGISVHFRTPIIGRDSEYVQTDFMLVPDVKFAQFALGNDEEPPFKGMHRNVVIANLAKNANMRFSGIKGLNDRNTGATIEDKDPNRIAQILLGDNGARQKDLSNIKSILKFLMRKYKDINIVSTMLDEARQTIMREGLDIIDLTQDTVSESATSGGQRVGVQHLYSEYKSDQYSMSLENFQAFLNALQASDGVIQPANSNISEKADGMAVRFGVTPDDKYFLQGSYSGPVIDGDFNGKIKHEPTRLAFEKEFGVIKRLVYRTLLRYKKDLDLYGIRVQCEWLYSPFALKREDSANLVYFVATNYEKDKLGVWSTFPIINITDFQGEDLQESVKFDIIKSLSDLSNADVKFLPLDIDVFNPIDLSADMTAAIQEIKSIESQYPNYREVLGSDSRKREDQKQKKEMREHIVRALLPYQKRMHLKILKELNSLAGKLGEYEGLVIKLKQANGEPFIFKVISPTFHRNKGRI